jgi:molybdate/tungstate transport system substrate-binding protein
MRVKTGGQSRILTPRRVLGVTLAVTTLAGAACGSSKKSTTATTAASSATTAASTATTAASSTTTAASTATTAAATPKGSGDVDVFSAGSLETLITKSVAPAFHAATGYTLVDNSHGSSALAADIKNKVSVADVFISASPAVNATLEGPANGNWVSWYAAFASSPLVLGYYPKSKFATDLKTMPWYDVITKPGFRLGRTDPTQDPGGVLAAEALNETAASKNLPALKTLATETSDEYAENPEEADILTGQLDGAFMYLADANSQASPYVQLPGLNLAGQYTITVVKGAPHQAAAEAFINFLLGPTGQAEMKADQFEIVSPPKVTGTGVPSGLSNLIGG